ncbi:venom carboxylesterase-6-like [Rhopalosiphum padi]|uniref:venom carboxylesterase-6-like n=1 Tax=Rhopalosiphum padi TaxID=40932 RepID=UPI00298D60BF|nr:venom carboxylesterase-6-like [Rhopalosiphum padi]
MRLIIVLLLTRLYCLVAGNQFPVVEIESGPISGILSKTWKGRTIYSFQGIPYATPPVGKLRFQEAQPIKPWLGVWNASSPGSKCIQYDHSSYLIEGDEDCLYANVYTPKLPVKGKSNKLLNVLVFIHGGAFMFLYGSVYQPDYILDKDIILVTFNYRLGPIGFFSTGDSVVSGNNGLKDQVQALKWVKRNIKYFGGNPENITISGMSAGGASVHFHMLSPLSRGLFQRVFSQSGTALCPWTIAENVPAKSAAIGAYLGCPTHPSKELVECLITRPALHIVEAVKIFFPFLYNPYSPFGPVVELPSENAFISELPYNIFAKGLATDVPWLSSVATHEGLYPGSEFINNPNLLKYIDENWNKVLPHILDYNYTIPQDKIDYVSELIRKEYIGSKKLVKGNTEEFIQMISDRLFVVDIIKAAKIHAHLYKSPVYLYQFGYRGRHSLSEHFSKSNENYGASHADDTGYALRNVYANVEDSELDKSLVPIIVDIWTSFAFKGIPSTGISSINWIPVSKDPNHSAVSFLKISSPTNITMDEVEDMGRTRFWDSLDFNENEHYSYHKNKDF